MLVKGVFSKRIKISLAGKMFHLPSRVDISNNVGSLQKIRFYNDNWIKKYTTVIRWIYIIVVNAVLPGPNHCIVALLHTEQVLFLDLLQL